MEATAQESQALQAYRQGNMDPHVRSIVEEYHSRCGVDLAIKKAAKRKDRRPGRLIL